MTRLHGLHHVTAITGDAPANVDFYARVLGLRMVKKTVNFDAPEVYHLYYGSEEGSPGTVLTFFEFPGARRGRAGAGMIHRVAWEVGSADALDFWQQRLGGEGVETQRDGPSLRFSDPESLDLELVVSRGAPVARSAAYPSIPSEHALRGFGGVRAYNARADASSALLEGVLGFEGSGSQHTVGGARLTYDPPPPSAGVEGAGTVHHVAWASADEDHASWRSALVDAGAHPTPIIDRTYFRSIYFREPSGVLFEIATVGPGFAIDEPVESLGQSLQLPARYEPMRAHLESALTPITNPRAVSAPPPTGGT